MGILMQGQGFDFIYSREGDVKNKILNSNI